MPHIVLITLLLLVSSHTCWWKMNKLDEISTILFVSYKEIKIFVSEISIRIEFVSDYFSILEATRGGNLSNGV